MTLPYHAATVVSPSSMNRPKVRTSRITAQSGDLHHGSKVICCAIPLQDSRYRHLIRCLKLKEFRHYSDVLAPDDFSTSGEASTPRSEPTWQGVLAHAVHTEEMWKPLVDLTQQHQAKHTQHAAGLRSFS